jgi:hypothetical protein
LSGATKAFVAKPAYAGAVDVVRVDAASSGEVHENELVENPGPPFRLTHPRDLAQIVDRALARHAAAGVHTAAHLIDVERVGVELQVLFLAFEGVVTFDRLHLQLHHQVVADLLPGVVLEMRKHLDGRLGLFALAHELLREIRLAAHVHREENRILLDRFRVPETNNGLHAKCSLLNTRRTSCAPTLEPAEAGMLRP